MSEVDELDSLDPAALACYAFATPAAKRATELGDDYMKRISGSGGSTAKAAKPTGKAKGIY